ncbi:MAG: tyrosine-protein phosphatase [Deltaproteobacteria bacterium]|nr:tyrosine-protein phosphatase [Deltaproteobacteria bacterium]
MKMKKIPFHLALIFLSFLAVGARAHETTTSVIPNLRQVSADLWRGGLPGAAGIKELAELKIQTVLNVQSTNSEIRAERIAARKYGIRFISIQLAPLFFKPSHKRMEQVLSVLLSASGSTLFVHCRHGEDRTGFAVGLYRVFVQGWTPDAAYAEMLERGFHPDLERGLKCAFDQKTGRPVDAICELIPEYEPD